MADSLTKELIKEICAIGDKTSLIPETTETGSNALSYAQGFPVTTATPQSDGGIPPKRTDMNKVLNLLSKNQVFLQNGGVYTFDSSISTAIGGYPLGAVLRFYDEEGSYLVRSLVANNTEEPSLSNIQFFENETGKKWKCIEKAIVKTYQNGNDGYILWNDGRIEQYGRVENTSIWTDRYIEVTFSIEFKDISYQVRLDPFDGKIQAGSNNIATGVLSPTKSSMNIIMYAVDYKPNYINWKAEGYVNRQNI
ncbi:MAG: hypothetical protein IKB70_00320 [Bacilli bacterium]|nr:hypothetical protein [Bacilli bacterium]